MLSLYEPIERVTPNEYQVLQLMAEGYSNREIAKKLCKSEETVKCQLKSVYNKLQVRTGKPGHKRVFAVRRAQELGIL